MVRLQTKHRHACQKVRKVPHQRASSNNTLLNRNDMRALVTVEACLFVLAAVLSVEALGLSSLSKLPPRAKSFLLPVHRVHLGFKFHVLRSKPSYKSNGELFTLEEQEASLSRRRREVQAELEQYERMLKRLRSDRIDYLIQSQQSSTSGSRFNLQSRYIETIVTESARRSAVKAIVWGVLAAFASLSVLSSRVSVSPIAAPKIFGTTTSVLNCLALYIGERLLNGIHAGRSSGWRRSLVKVLCWRFLATSSVLVLAMIVSRDISVASKMASDQSLFTTVLLLAYERVWAQVPWGKIWRYAI